MTTQDQVPGEWGALMEARLQKLETQNRILRLFLGVGGGIAIVVTALSCSDSTPKDGNNGHGVFNEIKARKFVLVEDRNGKEVEIGRWGYSDKGGLVLDHGGSSNNPRARIWASDTSGGMLVQSSNQARAYLKAGPSVGKVGTSAFHQDEAESSQKSGDEFNQQSLQESLAEMGVATPASSDSRSYSTATLTCSHRPHLVMVDNGDDQRVELKTGRIGRGAVLEMQEPRNQKRLELGRPTGSSAQAPYRLYYYDSGQRKPVEP